MKELRHYILEYVLVDRHNGSFLIDKENEHILDKYYWFIRPFKRGKGGTYVYEKYRKGHKQHFLHRIIMNAQPGQFVDHINGNTMDNRKSNLRFATKQENARNTNGNPTRRKYSKYHGVSFKRNSYCKIDGTKSTRRYWIAQVHVNGKQFSKSCKTEIEAAHAFNELAKKHFGEFARLNEI